MTRGSVGGGGVRVSRPLRGGWWRRDDASMEGGRIAAFSYVPVRLGPDYRTSQRRVHDVPNGERMIYRPNVDSVCAKNSGFLERHARYFVICERWYADRGAPKIQLNATDRTGWALRGMRE